MTSGQLLDTFHANWALQKPVVFRNLHRHMNSSLWTPESFSEDFGHLVVDLVNCRNHKVVENVPMRSFWLGFEDKESKKLM